MNVQNERTRADRVFTMPVRKELELCARCGAPIRPRQLFLEFGSWVNGRVYVPRGFHLVCYRAGDEGESHQIKGAESVPLDK